MKKFRCIPVAIGLPIIFILCLLLLISCVGAIVIVPSALVNNRLAKLEPETTKSPACVVHYDQFQWGSCVLNFDEVEQQFFPDGYLAKVVLAEVDRIWFVFIEEHESIETWNLACLNANGDDFQILYSGEFTTADGADYSFRVNNRCRSTYYAEENVFYYDGKIVLTDHAKLVEYDIQTETAREMDAENYSFPTFPFDVEIEQYQTVSIAAEQTVRVMTPENLAGSSEAFSQILKMESKKTFYGESVLKQLFDQVQYDGRYLYFICCVLDYNCDTHAVVFKYDFETGSFQYCFNYHISDIIGERLYIVPSA